MVFNRSKLLRIFFVAVLGLLVVLLFLILHLSNAFFYSAGPLSAIIFGFLTWVIAKHFIHRNEISETKLAKFITAVLIVILFVMVPGLWLSIGARKTFYAYFFIDVALILATSIHLLRGRVVSQRRRGTRAQTGLWESEVRADFKNMRRVAGLPVEFSYASLEAATGGFGDLLGRGASGAVFRGVLDDGTLVAVKRIAPAPRARHEFRSEFSAIAAVQHVNLTRLLGYCVAIPADDNDEGPYYLVYEFVPNGSLDAWIFPGARARGSCLSWEMRRQVAVDMARALAYIHHDCRSRILHLDVKPENVLLDEDFRARVTDFGLSRLMEREESRVVTTVRGTRGYLAPEWFLEGAISEKSDVYSFGIVLLEIIGGKRSVRMIDGGEKWSYFPRQVSECVRERRVMGVVDERIVGEVEEREVKVLIYVGLWCVNEKPGLRPTMAQVVDMLEFRVPVDEPPEDTQALMANLFLGGGSSTSYVSNRDGSVGTGGYSTKSTSLVSESIGTGGSPIESTDSVSVSIQSADDRGSKNHVGLSPA
ncbi:putative receptor-like protein kinase [Acorus gramineus]|uniref:Receptor-like protein kinase n=1 Tax=Acorus gramineus TaxID=55184 RepID=A0AAV9A6G5_ACOGR|nr:putative receptor-like protein kinase [Acorus gramineus]